MRSRSKQFRTICIAVWGGKYLKLFCSHLCKKEKKKEEKKNCWLVFCHISPVMWAEKLGKQLGNPTRSVTGWLVSKLLTSHNRVLEESAVQLSGIQPGDTVLELGHGPGLGLQSAVKLLTEPTGHLIGVDYSEYMHQVKYEYWQSGIKYLNSIYVSIWHACVEVTEGVSYKNQAQDTVISLSSLPKIYYTYCEVASLKGQHYSLLE